MTDLSRLAVSRRTECSRENAGEGKGRVMHGRDTATRRKDSNQHDSVVYTLTESHQLHCECVKLCLVLQWLGLVLVGNEELDDAVHPAHEEAAAVMREGVVLHLFGEQQEDLGEGTSGVGVGQGEGGGADGDWGGSSRDEVAVTGGGEQGRLASA